MEYAPQGIRVNVVAPGVVDTPLHKDNPKEFLRTLSPLGQISDAKGIAEAVFYLTEASQVTGEVLHVDGGAHLGLACMRLARPSGEGLGSFQITTLWI
jgi:NAD(P)-dependent dehydrogenase (short-subunit alcohol dehydrogenase family)